MEVNVDWVLDLMEEWADPADATVADPADAADATTTTTAATPEHNAAAWAMCDDRSRRAKLARHKRYKRRRGNAVYKQRFDDMAVSEEEGEEEEEEGEEDEGYSEPEDMDSD